MDEICSPNMNALLYLPQTQFLDKYQQWINGNTTSTKLLKFYLISYMQTNKGIIHAFDR